MPIAIFSSAFIFSFIQHEMLKDTYNIYPECLEINFTLNCNLQHLISIFHYITNLFDLPVFFYREYFFKLVCVYLKISHFTHLDLRQSYCKETVNEIIESIKPFICANINYT